MDREKQIAQSRIYAYDTIIGILSCLPDENFEKIVKDAKMKDFLRAYGALGHSLLSQGARNILSYVEEKTFDEETLDSLAVDRTKILRVPQKGQVEPPYESRYCTKDVRDGLLVQLQKAYIESGYIPVDAKDTADFLLIELDFVKKLVSLGEQDKQRAFLNEHLGVWGVKYALSAAEKCETDFYRGWLQFMAGFLQIEMEYLG